MKRKKHKRVSTADKGCGVTMRIVELPEPTCAELVEAHMMATKSIPLVALSLENMFNQHAPLMSGFQIGYIIPMEKSNGRQ